MAWKCGGEPRQLVGQNPPGRRGAVGEPSRFPEPLNPLQEVVGGLELAVCLEQKENSEGQKSIGDGSAVGALASRIVWRLRRVSSHAESDLPLWASAWAALSTR